MCEECMTREQMAQRASEIGCPGPDAKEHPDGHDGECYCQLCQSYCEPGCLE